MDDDARRDEENEAKDKLGLAATVLRRSKHLSQLEIAERLGVGRKRVSQIETGEAATHQWLREIADCVGNHTVHVDKLLDVLDDLAGEQRRQADPLAPTPEQERILYGAVRKLGRHFDALFRGPIRRQNLDAFLQTAAAEWERLEELDPARLRAEVRGNPGFHTWSFSCFLCAESVRQAVRDPRKAIRIARLAVVAARRCDLPWADRLVAHALAHLANTFRVAGQHDKAERLFERAHRLWDSPGMAEVDPGVLDPGRILDLEASLRKDQRRLPEALELLRRAFRISRFPGRILFNRAITLGLMGSYEDAIATLRRADELLEEREPRDEFVLNLNLGVNLCHLGRFDEAATRSAAASAIAEASGNRIDELRSLWLQARVVAGRGEGTAALEFYRLLHEELGRLGLKYDLALVSLELAAVLLALGRTRDCRSLAARLPTYFAARGIHQEALEALQVFSESVLLETATEAFARQVTAFLYLSRGNPDLRFQPAGS